MTHEIIHTDGRNCHWMCVCVSCVCVCVLCWDGPVTRPGCIPASHPVPAAPLNWNNEQTDSGRSFKDLTEKPGEQPWKNAAHLLWIFAATQKRWQKQHRHYSLFSSQHWQKGCTLHSRFKTNWLWWCLNYVPSSCKTLPWHGDVISCGPAETPLPYFLLPCTLNRSALRNVPWRLCSRACIIWPQNSLFPTSKHYLPRTSVKPDKDLAICQCRSPQTGCD